MKRKGFFSRLLSHDIVLLVISFVIAFGVWFLINTNSDTEGSITVNDIPINIDIENDELQVFGVSDDTASVTVSGNRVMIGGITAADLSVSAGQDTAIDTAGEYTLDLSVKKASVNTNYTIDTSSLSPASITAYIDRIREAEFDIDNQIVFKVNDNHYASVALSDSSVIISGPDTIVSTIASVAVMGTIDGEQSADTLTVRRNLTFLDSTGNEVSSPYISSNIDDVTVTANIYPVMDVNLKLNMLNAPDDPPSIKLSPSTIKIAGPQDTLDEIEDDTITIGNFDYSTMTNTEVELKMDISLPTGLRNLSNDTSVTVATDLSDYVKKSITCKISSNLNSSEYRSEFNADKIEITAYGPKDVIDTLSASNISVIADFSANMSEIAEANTLSLSVPLTVTLTKSYTSCWIYGSYTADVTVSKK